ncbi:MAG TPA: peptidoglycan DD-metalloendopeptidase family protein [Flavobacterium sp.]|jgi:murein DD-endopeptidase MepM/ murein hydrolase activator NlpD
MSFERFLSSQSAIKVIDTDGPYCPLDLSVQNKEAGTMETAEDLENYLDKYKKENSCRAPFGGYNERRNLYKNSSIFNNSDEDERDIHIGVDIWMKAGTSVFAALEGKVHGFNYNAGKGNYGPTIIVEHRLENYNFLTLYGHLSMESIEEIEIGDSYKRGQKLGSLGSPSINGNYAPHLHFQLIKDMGDYFGDYPGVCNEKDLEFYLSNCPDPNLLLKLIDQ